MEILKLLKAIFYHWRCYVVPILSIFIGSRVGLMVTGGIDAELQELYLVTIMIFYVAGAGCSYFLFLDEMGTFKHLTKDEMTLQQELYVKIVVVMNFIIGYAIPQLIAIECIIVDTGGARLLMMFIGAMYAFATPSVIYFFIGNTQRTKEKNKSNK